MYSVSANSSLRYAIEKILASMSRGSSPNHDELLLTPDIANAHRVFVTEDPHSGGSSPVTAASSVATSKTNGNGAPLLRGVVSVVDSA